MADIVKISFEEHTKGRSFITDLGIEKQIVDPVKMELVTVGRYGIWSPNKDGIGHEILETAINIKELQDKYNVEDELVLAVNTPEEDITNE
jgi:hypothetical protein